MRVSFETLHSISSFIMPHFSLKLIRNFGRPLHWRRWWQKAVHGGTAPILWSNTQTQTFSPTSKSLEFKYELRFPKNLTNRPNQASITETLDLLKHGQNGLQPPHSQHENAIKSPSEHKLQTETYTNLTHEPNRR